MKEKMKVNINDMLNEMWAFIDTHNINAMSIDDVELELDKIEQKYK